MLGKLFKRDRKPKADDTSSADACGVPAAPAKGKVLVVDDDAVVRKTLNIKLRAAGYQVLEAPDGAAALAEARAENPDVIIMDIFLPPEPGMTWDGFSLIKWLGHPHGGIRCPFIVITGGDSADLRDKALAAGAAGFFQKPLDMPALLATIEKLVPAPSQPGPA
jgi:CheY-like chemotaxis protein